MSMKNELNRNIPKEKFAFVQMDASIHDSKLDTKGRSFFADALIRFKKNKSSVIATWILAFLLLYSIVAPLLVPYDADMMDKMYVSYPPFHPAIAEKGWGILDGSRTMPSVNENGLLVYEAIELETGRQVVLKKHDPSYQTVIERGQEVTKVYYEVDVNMYYLYGVSFMVFKDAEYQNILAWQEETGIRVIYPYVESKDVKGSTNGNVWYEVKNEKGTPKLDKDGNFVPAYSSNSAIESIPYTGTRVEGDPGTYIYCAEKAPGTVQARVDYYAYYQYLNGFEPIYLFGTNSLGQDVFSCIGIGARFSLIFAIVISALNMIIGAIYGAIQGYYGGKIDLVMDRISDILSGIPFIVAVTLFQLHLGQKVGTVGSLFVAFIATGWIGMSALTRKQFYRFKSQEFVLSARTLGASDWRLMFKHIFPNALGTIITSCALTIPGVISSETNLTYLGIVNIQSFAGTSIGTLMQQGSAAMTTAPYALFYPALYLGLLMICFNLFGNGLRDAFNPALRGGED